MPPPTTSPCCKSSFPTWRGILPPKRSWHRAWQHYNQAVALNLDDFEAYANMGAIALSQGRAEGTRLLERSLSANPHHFTAWRIYVQYLSDQGQFDRVRQLIDQARPLLPTEQLAALARISSR